MKKTFKSMILIATYLLMLCSLIFNQANAANKPKFSRFIILGDSLTDVGKMYDKSNGLIPADSPPLDWSTPLYYNGRFSNGPIWIDYLEQRYNMNEHQVINESEGGATIYSYLKKSFNPAYLVINTLSHEISEVFEKIDDHKAAPINDNDLVIIWMGANDLITFEWLSPQDIYDDITQLYISVDTLVSAGVKNIIFFNLPELVLTPKGYQMDQDEYDDIKRATDEFNHELSLATTTMSAFYSLSGVQIKLYDIKSVFDDTLTHPEDYGITDTRHACYTGSLRNVIISDNTQYTHSVKELARQWNIAEPQLVEFLQDNPVFANSMQWYSKEDELNGIQLSMNGFDPNDCHGYLFFDSVHPTTEIHQDLSDFIYAFINENWYYQSIS